MNPREAASLVAIISAAYPQWPASRETVAVYADALGDLDYDDALAAVRDLVLTEDRWPTVATIRRRTAQRAGLLSPSPADAWAEIRRLTSTGLTSTTGAFSHPAIAETVASIGWWDLCHSTNPETIRAQFLRLYADAQRHNDTEILTTPGRISLGDGSRDRLRGRDPMAATLPASA
jgi:hypothetical protein